MTKLRVSVPRVKQMRLVIRMEPVTEDCAGNSSAGSVAESTDEKTDLLTVDTAAVTTRAQPAMAHESIVGGDLGIQKTVDRITSGQAWLQM